MFCLSCTAWLVSKAQYSLGDKFPVTAKGQQFECAFILPDIPPDTLLDYEVDKELSEWS